VRRLGFIYPEPEPLSPINWSGTPRSLALGLQSLGVEVVPIAYRLPRPLRHTITILSFAHGRGAVARAAPLKTSARNRVITRELANAGPLDAVLALGTDLYDLARVAPPSLPVATYDDGTFALFMRYPDSDLRRNAFPEDEVAQWSQRQAQAARWASSVCVSTRWAAASMTDDYGVAAERVHVVGMGHRPRPHEARARNWSRPRFLFVGVDWGRKNGDAVLRAFARVREVEPAASLDVVGNHPRLELPGVVGHGFLPREDPRAQQRLDDLYAQATVFVLPSRFDPAGVAYLEAASAGLPVIATTEGGAGEMLGSAAISVHPDDDAGLVAAMRRLADPDIARRLGADGARAAAGSTWPAVAGRIISTLGRASAQAGQSLAATLSA
jgi:glycosyltransferase involved in cell wall biosynthesis